MKYLLLLALLFTSYAHSARSITWDKSVIDINLIVGTMQQVQFEVEPAVNVSPLLVDRDVFRSYVANDIAHWEAYQPFENERVRVRIGETIIIFNVSARTSDNPPKSAERIHIISDYDATAVSPEQQTINARQLKIFQMVRFAAQIDETIPRARQPIPGIQEVRTTDQELSRLYKSQWSTALDMRAVASYTAGGFYVTTIKIRNITHLAHRFDHRRFEYGLDRTSGYGKGFLIMAIVDPLVLPKVVKDGHTFLYVVTNEPFHDVIELGVSK